MSYNVILKTIPERYAATIRMTIPRYEDEGMIWGRLAEETCRMNLMEDDPCLCAVTYLDGEYKQSIGLLYGIAFTIKMSKMGDHRIDGYFDYVVPPLEGIWWQEGVQGIDYAR